MEKYLIAAFTLALISLTSSCKKEESQPDPTPVFGEAVDIENNTYVTVEINDDVWFVENLATKLFANGDTIIEARTNEEWQFALYNQIPAWCYPVNDSTQYDTHGLMYNFYALTDPRGLAPEGWHVSSSGDWQKLIDDHGGEWNAGNELKYTSGWNNDGNGSNSTHFCGLPGGYRISTGSFMTGIGEYGWWWTSTPIDGSPSPGNYAVLLPSTNNLVNIVDNYGKDYGFYARCVKD